MKAVVIGIGNPVLSDDSVGLQVAREVGRRIGSCPCVSICEEYSGGMSLLEAITGHDLAILVDSITTGSTPPGTVHEFACDDTLFTRNTHSTHNGSLTVALELARATGVPVPGTIRVWGIEAADVTTFSEALTPAVEPAVSRATQLILQALVAAGARPGLRFRRGFEAAMKIGVYFCNCGGSISDNVDPEAIAREFAADADVLWREPFDFLCSEDGKQFLLADIAETQPDRIVIAACSPREHESTFMRVAAAGTNPYFVQLANIREHVAWVTEDRAQATRKASRLIAAAVARVKLHDPLTRGEIDVCRDVLVVGAGPAGLKCALALAEAGRKVTIVEKSPVLGGAPVRYEEVFPTMECAPCMLEPLLGEVLHGEHAQNIDVLTLSELVDVTGYYGNFSATVRQCPRYVNADLCIGCGECVAPCPQLASNEYNYGMDQRRAIAFPFAGALPNAPFIDRSVCVRGNGIDCELCRDACPVPEAIVFDDRERSVTKAVGAIVLATGFDVFDGSSIPALGYRRVAGVHSSAEFERVLASNGPTGGAILCADGRPPQSVAIIHCVGGLDERYRPYCSGVCCSYAFKFNHLIRKKLPGTSVHHLYKEVSVSGKGAFALYREAAASADSVMTRYGSIDDLRVDAAGGRISIRHANGTITADLVVLCAAMEPAADNDRLCEILETGQDRFGFFDELHGRMDPAQSKIRGVYVAGSCHGPMSIERAVTDGIAAAGYVISGLADGRKLTIDPVRASADQELCCGCRVCTSICPYKAITFTGEPGRAEVNALLCHGCGTCVAACPSGAMRGNHFTNDQIVAEMEALLQ